MKQVEIDLFHQSLKPNTTVNITLRAELLQTFQSFLHEKCRDTHSNSQFFLSKNPQSQSFVQMAPKLTEQTFLPTLSAPSDFEVSISNSPQPSPKDVRLPPSPPNEIITEEEDYVSPETILPRRPAGPSRYESYPLPSPVHLSAPTLQLSFRPRNASPSRPQIRPHTSGGISAMPLMQRAHSSPGVDSSGRFITPSHVPPRRPSSPLHSGRRRSPLRSAMEDIYPSGPSWSGLNIEPNIPEHEELDLSSDPDFGHHSPNSSYANTFPRSRRKPSSPLHQSASAPALYARSVSPTTSGATSPSLLVTQRFANEPYPLYSFSSASSVPSTPTSIRSRSPSISSLETIEDTPDAEEAARLEEEEARTKMEESEDIPDLRRRSSLELRGSNLRSNKERKRWSVCGAERRADFSLEPIEE